MVLNPTVKNTVRSFIQRLSSPSLLSLESQVDVGSFLKSSLVGRVGCGSPSWSCEIGLPPRVDSVGGRVRVSQG